MAQVDDDPEADEHGADSTPTLVKPRERLPPGSRPPVPAVFLRFAVPLPRLADVLADCERRATAHERRRRLLLRVLPLVLAGAALLWPLIDLAAGMGQLGFARFAPLLVGAALLVPWALAPNTGEPDGPAIVLWRGLGPVGVVLLFMAAFVGLVAWFFAGFTWWLGVMALIALRLAFVVVGALVTRRRIWHAVRADLRRLWTRYWGPPAWQPALAEVRALVDALTPLVASTTQATGWLDLSGPIQPWKKLTHVAHGTGLDASGLRRFLDHWFFLDVRLRDGVRLRLRALERVTVDQRLPASEPEAEARWAEYMAQRASIVIVRLDDPQRDAEAPAPRPALLAALGLQRPRVRAARMLAEWPAPGRNLRPEALVDAVRGALRELAQERSGARPR